TATVIATRGERIALCRTIISGEDQQPGAFRIEFLSVIQITADERIAARSAFELDDFDAAIAELDARYLASEAAPYAQMWSLTLRAFAALNRHELPPTTPDWVNVDHRAVVGSHAGEVWAALRAVWELVPGVTINIEAVHRLSDVGTVVTFAARGASEDGFDAEWRDVTLIGFEGDLINRGEVFDEADLAAALAKFDQLSGQTRRLENAASRVYERFQAHLSARDWEALAKTVGDNSYTDDRRRVVNAGIRHDRDAVNDLRALADVGFKLTLVDVIAIRGERLALTHVRGSGQDPGAIESDAFNVVEIGADERFSAVIVFELEEFDAAIAELDARYLAGEA